MKRNPIIVVLTLVILTLFACGSDADKVIELESALPKRVILFISDAMPVGAPERIPLPVFQELKKEGCYYKEMHVILAAHPQRNDNENAPAYYPWGCSLPNPVAITGTVFIGLPEIKQHMLQYSFQDKKTAFTVNCGAYDEISPGYTIFHQLEKNGFPDLFKDEMPVEDTKKIIENDDPAFIRIHLQGPGSAGHIVFQGPESYHDAHLKYAEKDGSLPWYKNIWHPKSPYIHQALYADSLLGDFVNWLKETGRWDETVLIVMGDHGQWDQGTHPPYAPKSNMTPFLIVGKGIKEGQEYDAAEILDLAPTIAYISGVPEPKFASGRVLKECMIGGPKTVTVEPQLLKLNQLLIKHHQFLEQHPEAAQQPDFKALNDRFMSIETIGSWHNTFENIEEIIKHNQHLFEQL